MKGKAFAGENKESKADTSSRSTADEADAAGRKVKEGPVVGVRFERASAGSVDDIVVIVSVISGRGLLEKFLFWTRCGRIFSSRTQ